MANMKRSTKPARSATQSISRIESATTVKPLVFISHDSQDAELAEAFSKLLSGISAGMLKSFRSSDKKGSQGIEFGVEWYPEVMTQIDSATDVVCLLTPRSLERPWILYEAGVAKGKMNTPVFGVALGVPLAKASAGPFALFQNCGEDSDSLTKLVTQLMVRIPGAEPDKDTVKMQVDSFRTRASEVQSASSSQQEKDEAKVGADESVAKLFEEVKVMFRDLPGRLERRMDPNASRRKRRMVHPELFFQLGHSLGGKTRNDELTFLMIISSFKDELPWLYEIGLEVYRGISANSDREQALEALELFRHACDAVAHEPFMRDLVRDENIMFSIMEIRPFLKHLESRISRPEAPRKKTSEASKT